MRYNKLRSNSCFLKSLSVLQQKFAHANGLVPLFSKQQRLAQYLLWKMLLLLLEIVILSQVRWIKLVPMTVRDNRMHVLTYRVEATIATIL